MIICPIYDHLLSEECSYHHLQQNDVAKMSVSVCVCRFVHFLTICNTDGPIYTVTVINRVEACSFSL